MSGSVGSRFFAFRAIERGLTVHSTMVDAAGQLADKVTGVVKELWMVIGDVVALGSNACGLAGVDMGVAGPALNAFNGVGCFLAGVFILASGLEGFVKGAQKFDGATALEGALHMEIGATLGVAGPLKVIVGIMQVMQMMAFVPDVVVPFITALTYTFVSLFGLMFTGFVVRSIFYGVEMARFHREFKKILEEECGHELSHRWTLKGLYVEAASGVSDKEGFATAVVGHLRTKITGSSAFENLVRRTTRKDVVEEIISEKLERSKEKIIDHCSEKWVHKGIWTLMLGVLATVCIPMLILTLTFTTGPVGMAVMIAWIVIFAVMLIGFDGWSFIEAFKNNEPHKWDGIFVLGSMLLLTGVSIAVVVVTTLSGGVVPLIVCGVVGGILLLVHLAALIKVAHRKHLERRDAPH